MIMKWEIGGKDMNRNNLGLGQEERKGTLRRNHLAQRR